MCLPSRKLQEITRDIEFVGRVGRTMQQRALPSANEPAASSRMAMPERPQTVLAHLHAC